MIYLILALLLLAGGVCFARLLLLHAEIRHMERNLKEINETQTSAFLQLSTPNRSLERLGVEINRTIAQKQEAMAQRARMEITQRQNLVNISHDLRTPLTSVLGYLQLLEEETLPQEERKRDQAIIRSHAQDLNRLINDFFDLSRLEAGEYKFERTPLSLANILCEMAASFYPDFVLRKIEPEISIDQRAPMIWGDEAAVRQIFSNLIQNALKYAGSAMRVSLATDGTFVRVCFTNDAPQLTEEEVYRLFERFYTAERMRTGRNTGLGLAIVKQLMEQMNGKIEASLHKGRLTIQTTWRIAAPGSTLPAFSARSAPLR